MRGPGWVVAVFRGAGWFGEGGKNAFTRRQVNEKSGPAGIQSNI